MSADLCFTAILSSSSFRQLPAEFTETELNENRPHARQ